MVARVGKITKKVGDVEWRGEGKEKEFVDCSLKDFL